METPAPASIGDRLCSLAAAAARQDPIGSAGAVTRLLAIEVPPPWGDNLYQPDPHGTWLQRINAIQRDHYERLSAAGEADALSETGYPTINGIMPDPEWSTPDRRRALLMTRPAASAFAAYEVAEYLFPPESPALIDLARAVLDAPDEIGVAEAFRVPHGGARELFVCTHGQVDICCAKFGVPLYRQARAAYPEVRAWRMTHFGGHRYAPTAWEFPSGYLWGFLDEAASIGVLAREVHPAALARHVRGWAGVPEQVQLIDRLGLERHGWDWLRVRRRGEILEVDERAGRWRVRLDFEAPNGRRGRYEGTVLLARELADVGCGPEWGSYDDRSPEYCIESVTEGGD